LKKEEVDEIIEDFDDKPKPSNKAVFKPVILKPKTIE